MLDMGYPTHLVNFINESVQKTVCQGLSSWYIIGVFSCQKRSQTRMFTIPIIIQYYCRNGYEGNFRWIYRRITDRRAPQLQPEICRWHSLIATSQQELQELVDRLHRASGKYGLMLNKEKTKVMSTEDNTCVIYRVGQLKWSQLILPIKMHKRVIIQQCYFIKNR